jgi:SAM-dependent methyltransferase
MKYDLKLFKSLNEEYKDKPIVPAPRKLDQASITKMGDRRAITLDTKYKLSGQRVLEIGCGRGETCRSLVVDYKCTAVGTDIRKYPEWAASEPNLTFLEVDLAATVPPDLGQFDFAYSFSVFEHVRHPYSMLKSIFSLLKPGGTFHLYANLYRGAMASHRYREVFFPWPHLLFTDEVFEEFYVSLGRSPARPSWVNQLSIADYYRYFDLVGFKRVSTAFRATPIDEAFYTRFANKLERFPRFDLERDFITATLRKPDK